MNLLKTVLTIGATLSQTDQAFPPQQTTPSTVAYNHSFTNATEAERVAFEDQSNVLSDIQIELFDALDAYIPWGHKSSAVMWYLMSWVEFSSKKRNAITTYLSLPRGQDRQSAYEEVLKLYDMSKRNEFIRTKDVQSYPTLYGMNKEL